MYLKHSNIINMLKDALNRPGVDFSFFLADFLSLEKKEGVVSYMLKLHNTPTHKAWLQIHSGHQVKMVWTVQFAV